MVIGVGLVDILIPGCHSLKEKRGVLRRILKRTQNEFNISIAEAGQQDLWQAARIGFCVVGNDRAYINGKMDHVLRFIDDLGTAERVRTKMEILSLGDIEDDPQLELEKYGTV